MLGHWALQTERLLPTAAALCAALLLLQEQLDGDLLVFSPYPSLSRCEQAQEAAAKQAGKRGRGVAPGGWLSCPVPGRGGVPPSEPSCEGGAPCQPRQPAPWCAPARPLPIPCCCRLLQDSRLAASQKTCEAAW